MSTPDFVAADEYGLASELAFRLHGQVLGIEPRWAYFSGLPPQHLAGRTGLLVRSGTANTQARTRLSGPPSRRLAPSSAPRAGIIAETYHLFRVIAAPGTTGALLPQPNPRAAKLAPD